MQSSNIRTERSVRTLSACFYFSALAVLFCGSDASSCTSLWSEQQADHIKDKRSKLLFSLTFDIHDPPSFWAAVHFLLWAVNGISGAIPPTLFFFFFWFKQLHQRKAILIRHYWYCQWISEKQEKRGYVLGLFLEFPHELISFLP